MRDSFGDVAGEIQAIAERAAIVPDAFDLVWVEGPDAVRFLQGLLSQEIESMAPGTVARAFLLAPQGKLRALCWVVRDESRVGLAVDAGWADRVIDDLTNYRIRVKAELRREDRPVTSVWGPDSTRLVGLADAERWQESAGVLLAPIPMPGLARVLVVGDVDLADVPRAGRLAAAAQRVAAGEPEFGRDVDESTIPQETGLVPEAVSFTKGCYLGQELVARIDTRGHVNRRLRSLAITRNVLPPEGAGVFAGERQVGSATSVTEGLASPVALALLRREVEPGSEVQVRWEGGAVPAIVRSVPDRTRG